MASRATTGTSPLELLRTRSLMSVLQEEIERMILRGDIQPGERVNEFALAARFGTSRGPIREACRSLAHTGLVEVVPNRGVFVRKLGIEQASAIYEVRAVLFGLAGRLFAERISDAQVRRLRRFIAEMDAVAHPEGFERYYKLNLDFHAYIIEGAGNPVLARQYGALVKELDLFRRTNLVVSSGLTASNEEHKLMVEALARRDPEDAFKTHWAHVERSKRSLRSRLADPDPQSDDAAREPSAGAGRASRAVAGSLASPNGSGRAQRRSRPL